MHTQMVHVPGVWAGLELAADTHSAGVAVPHVSAEGCAGGLWGAAHGGGVDGAQLCRAARGWCVVRLGCPLPSEVRMSLPWVVWMPLSSEVRV